MRACAIWLTVVAAGSGSLGAEEPIQPDFSQPLTLSQCLAIALASHPSITAAQAGLESSRYRVTESKASRLPQLDLSSNWSRFQSTRQGFVIGSAGASENRETALGLSYLFLDSGQRETAIRQARASAGSTEATLAATRQDIALAVVQAYYDLLTGQKLKTLRERVVASAEQHVAQAQAGVDAGTKARIDVLRAQTELANAKVDLVAADGSVQRAKATLRNAMGIAEVVPLTIREEPQLPDPALSLADAQKEALSKRPELRRQDLTVLGSQESLRSAKIEAGPSVRFTGGLDEYFDSTRNITREWVLSAAVSYPLFDGKQSRSRVESARADLDARKQQRERERQSVMLQVERALIAVNDAKARLEAANVARAQAEENRALNEASYEEGVATMVEVIDAQAAAAQAETSLIQAQYDFNLAVMTLRHALGRSLVAPAQP